LANAEDETCQRSINGPFNPESRSNTDFAVRVSGLTHLISVQQPTPLTMRARLTSRRIPPSGLHGNEAGRAVLGGSGRGIWGPRNGTSRAATALVAGCSSFGGFRDGRV